MLLATLVAWALLLTAAWPTQAVPVAADQALVDHGGHAAPSAHAGHGVPFPTSADAPVQPCGHCSMGHAHCLCAMPLPSVSPALADGARLPWQARPDAAPAGLAVPPDTPPPIA